MAVVSHGPKDTIDQITELSAALARHLELQKQQVVDEAKEAESAVEKSTKVFEAIQRAEVQVQILRNQATSVREAIESVRRASR